MKISNLMGVVQNCVAGLGRGFRVQVEWPLNMVVDRSTQNLYQALLRHLLGLAMVERELHIIWRTYQSTRALFRRALCLLLFLHCPVVVQEGLWAGRC